MSRLIVIHWEATALRAAVLRPASNRVDVETVIPLSLEGDDQTLGERLAAALEKFTPARSPVIVAASRELLTWQHLSLPPCPEEDLPDMVRMQSDYSPIGGELGGLDFLPLVGDAFTPRRVWAISVSVTQLTRLRRIFRAAEFAPKHLVPLCLGWPAWTRHVAQLDAERATVWIAPTSAEPTIWATAGQRMVLLRQLQLPTALDQLAPAVARELRRTLLAFGQEQPQAGEPLVRLVGERGSVLGQLAVHLTSELRQQVEVVGAESTGSVTSGEVSLATLGLALAAANGEDPPTDLLHPHHRPAPRTSRRTYVLTAAAAASLALMIAWKGYSNLRAPLDAAAAAQAEITLLEEQSGPLREAEQRANAIRLWLNGSVNLLEEIELLSTHVRPQPLDAKDFPLDTDVVVGKVALQNRQFTIDALARENRVVQPLETRLRDGIHRVQRGKVEPSEALPGYPLAFQSIVDVTNGATAEEASTP